MNGFIGKMRKKRDSRTILNHNIDSPSSSSTAVLQLVDDETTLSDVQCESTDADGDLGAPTNCNAPLHRKSTIVRTLQETLNDSSALAYLIQFMQSIDQVSLIKFWLDVQSFRVSSKDIATHPDSFIQLIKQDAGEIFAKYLGKDAVCAVGITDSIRDSTIQRICCSDGSIDVDCFADAQRFVYNILDNRYFMDFLKSVYYCKHQLDVVTSGTVRLVDILHNDMALPYFMEVLDSYGYRLLEFWVATNAFEEDLRRRKEYDADDAQRDAMILYDRYFSMQTIDRLGFGDNLRMRIESNICREGGPLPDCFDCAQKVVLNILEQKYLNIFLRSAFFQKYVCKLIHTIEHTIELPNCHHRPNKANGSVGASSSTCSDQSSDLSFISAKTTITAVSPPRKMSTTSTLIGDGNESVGKRRTSSTDSFYSTDDRLCGDSLLTRRSRKDKSLAKIDNLGRYRRAYDDRYVPDELPTTKTHKLLHSFDKYRNTKDEALLADQVAQLIIADVNNMVSSTAAAARGNHRL